MAIGSNNVLGICVLSCLVIGTCFADDRCPTKEVQNVDGWDVPAKTAARSQGQRLRFRAEDNLLADLRVVKGQQAKTNLFILRCDPTGTRVIYRNQPSRIEEIWVFSYRTRIFAYRVLANWIIWDRKQGRYYELGTRTSVLFIDDDGSGKFKVMRFTDDELPFRLRIPDWAKEPVSPNP